MIERINAYMQKVLGTGFVITPYEGEKTLPYLYQGLYHLFLCSGNNTSFLLLCDKGSGILTPARIAKHGENLRNIFGLTTVFVTDEMPAYNRERLLKKHMPFIVPERQLYMPFCGVVQTESGAKLPKEFAGVGNLAQQILLARLNRRFIEPLSISQAGIMFPYSRISIIRAFDELEYFKLASRDLKTKHLTFSTDGKALWEAALPLLRNPCRRVIGLENIPDGLQVFAAGTTALSQRTMLSESPQQEVAAQVGDFNKLRTHVFRSPQADAPVLLQLWIYPPNAIGGNEIDPLSLYLTLKSDSDERVQIALDEMLKGIPW